MQKGGIGRVRNGGVSFAVSPIRWMVPDRKMRSFSLVDHKVAEADFFLKKISESNLSFFAVRCYVSAFVSATRSITFALQSVLGRNEGFDQWYSRQREKLETDPTARFFRKFRTVNQHIGANLVSGGTAGPDAPVRYWFAPTSDVREVPVDDVETACRTYLKTVIEIVFDCYMSFGPVVDPQQYYRQEYFRSIGKTIEDAEEELGYPRGWTETENPNMESDRWRSLRNHAGGCEIDDIFQEYLGKTTPAILEWRKLSQGGNDEAREKKEGTGDGSK